MSSNATFLINPNDPFQYLPADFATSIRAAQFVQIGTLCAYVWDLLLCLPNDYRVIILSKKTISTLIYVIAKLATLFFVLFSWIFSTFAVEKCQEYNVGLTIAFAVAIPFTCLLFDLRVVALWGMNKIVIAIFAVLWLTVTGLSIAVPFGVGATTVGNTGTCVNTAAATYISGTYWAIAAHDTCVLIGVLWRISSLYNSSPKSVIQQGYKKGEMPAFTRLIMMDGLFYFLVTMFCNVIVGGLTLSHLNPLYRVMFTIPAAGITTAMAGRVFVRAKLHGTMPELTDLIQRAMPSEQISYGQSNQTRFGPKPFASSTESSEAGLAYSTRGYERAFTLPSRGPTYPATPVLSPYLPNPVPSNDQFPRDYLGNALR